MKLTAVRCDTCNAIRTYRNWARLWRDAQRDGWVLGKSKDQHFCSEACREAYETPKRTRPRYAWSGEKAANFKKFYRGFLDDTMTPEQKEFAVARDRRP